MKTRNDLTAEYVRANLAYDPATGVLTWKIARSNIAAGTPTGCPSGGYLVVRLRGRNYMAHRLIWLIVTGEWPVADVDHRDLNGENNVWTNLRPATRSQNLSNQGLKGRNKSGYKGVSWHAQAGKWQASIGQNGKSTHLGLFDEPAAASMAYAQAAVRLFGEFARAA